MDPQPHLRAQVRHPIRIRHSSSPTEDVYGNWIRRNIPFQGKRDPRDLTAVNVDPFLTDLSVNRRVAASTQNQAFAALLFRVHRVPRQPLEHRISAGVTRRCARAAP